MTTNIQQPSSSVAADALTIPTPTSTGGSGPRLNRRRPKSQASGPEGAGSAQRQHRAHDEAHKVGSGSQRRRTPRVRDGGERGSDVSRPQSGQSGVMENQTGEHTAPSANQGHKHPQNSRKPQPPGDTKRASDTPSRPSKGKGRASRFQGELTQDQSASLSTGPKASVAKGASKYRSSLPQGDDLTSSLIRDLSTSPYPDCLICFAAIRPNDPTYSCSPTIPIASSTDDEEKLDTQVRSPVTSQCCWTTFHLKCIKAWASKSVKDTEEAWLARGEARQGVWRCPGCQLKRTLVPSVYRCFCGSVVDPKPPRLATPHSCASPCTRVRTCSHSCPIPCHPGPCPPCQVSTQKPCFCGKKTLTFRCSNLAPTRTQAGHAAETLSCGQSCDKWLDCGNHKCELPCHDGPCQPCRVRSTARCYCGKEERDLGCGIGQEKECLVLTNDVEERWLGRFECENICDRSFDCGVHKCAKRCHVPSRSPAPCPRSPAIVHTCPCGRHTLEATSASFFPPNTCLSRTSCSDPIPTCASVCAKNLEGCSHLCASKCHTSPCPPCSTTVTRPCRCGSTTRDLKCSEYQAQMNGEQGEILCDRACTALRACGRHQCNRICCPLASLAGGKGKGKRKAASQGFDNGGLIDDAGWHACDLVCGKPLSCGNHVCEERDHRGPCPSCLRSSFEEMICRCGRTIMEPPVPCGTRINCQYPCDRPPLACGHPKTPHACHEDPAPCPPCPFLTTKACACGKKVVGNIKCSQEKVSCGKPCGKLLACGFHHCDRACHGDDCGPCHAVCGKSRKLCLPANHPCTLPCHAPASCSEAEPCRAIATLSCPCGRIRQPVACGRSTSNPGGREGSQQLKCSNDCLVAQRNARLAEALGINPEAKSSQVTYSDDLTAFAKANIKFCQLVEKTFSDFVTSEKKSQILPHMPESRRSFVYNLASVYRMDTQMVDAEPHRSVQLIRRVDTRIPKPTLSSAVASSGPGLGKLADLRAPVPQRAPAAPSRLVTATPPAHGSGSRGWTSVVAASTPAQRSNAPSPTAWLTEGSSRPRADLAPSPRPVQPLARTPTPSIPTTVVPDSWEDDT